MSSSHQSKFPCIIITIIIILLFFSSFSTLLTVNLFVLFWRCFVMLNSYFVCFIIYIFFSILKFFLLILFSFQKSGFVSAFIRSASYSNMRLSLIFAGLIFANMRLANLVPTSRRLHYMETWTDRIYTRIHIITCCITPTEYRFSHSRWLVNNDHSYKTWLNELCVY